MGRKRGEVLSEADVNVAPRLQVIREHVKEVVGPDDNVLLDVLEARAQRKKGM